MKFLKSAFEEVIGLFVADWTQTGITVAILLAGWFAAKRVQLGPLAFIIVALLAAQLVYGTTAEAHRRRATAKGK